LLLLLQCCIVTAYWGSRCPLYIAVDATWRLWSASVKNKFTLLVSQFRLLCIGISFA